MIGSGENEVAASCDAIPAGYPTGRCVATSRGSRGHPSGQSRLNKSKAGNYFEKISEIVRFTIAFQNAIDDDYSCWD
jgi:hypothetical protein